MLPASDFRAAQSRIFQVSGDQIYIGGDKIADDLRSTLRDEAVYISNSRLWELLNNSVTNEAANLALVQSTDWEGVQFAKALHHWAHYFRNVLYTSAKP